MMDQYLRNPLQKILVDPLLRSVCFRRFSSQTITLSITALGALCGIFAGAALIGGYLWTSVSFLLLSGYFDILDGSHARVHKTSSAKGAVLDIFCDRLVECTTIFSLYWIDPVGRSLVCLCMLSACFLCVTSFLVVGIFTENTSTKSFHYSPGIMERAEAFGFFLVMMLFPGIAIPLGWAFTLLVLLTSCIRLREFFLQSAIL
ncbi:MAG: CDP-alcohol phosphatidyltransferase family protein [Chlamydiota bacterium]